MSTYLALCQDVARDSGTVSTIGQPETTAGQSGRLLQVLLWVRDAYNTIQRHRSDWRWLRADFAGNTVTGVQAYNAAALGISERFDRWIHFTDRGDHAFTIQKASEDRATEGFLTFLDYEDFRRAVMHGSAAEQTGFPHYITEDDSQRLLLWPIPDAAYIVRGRYQKGLQTLSADAEVPEMPEKFHDAIKWRALMLLAGYDEAGESMQHYVAEYNAILGDLVDEQTPRIQPAEPLA